jgi:hypothetical protein
MGRDKYIKNQNEKWEHRKLNRVPQKYKHKGHPWGDTNRYIQNHMDKIWTDIITPENQRNAKCSEKKKY